MIFVGLWKMKGSPNLLNKNPPLPFLGGLEGAILMLSHAQKDQTRPTDVSHNLPG